MSETETVREVVEEAERSGYTYTIVRTNEKEWTRGSKYEYEFVASIDGENVMTASALETDGWEQPWADALRRYCESNIDGRVAAAEDD